VKPLPFNVVRSFVKGASKVPKKFNVGVQCTEPGSQGISMNVQVDANNVLEAVELAVEEVRKTLAASGLTLAAPPPAAPPAA
jgi:hypothetical protein